MHRHAPKRHAVLSFVVAHEGCDRLGQETDDSGSGTRKHRLDRQHPKIERVGSSHSRDRVPPLTSGTPKNHALTVNRDIDGPLPRLGSAPKRRRSWSPTEEIGWSRTQEIRWYPTQEIGWVRSEEILHYRGTGSCPSGGNFVGRLRETISPAAGQEGKERRGLRPIGGRSTFGVMFRCSDQAPSQTRGALWIGVQANDRGRVRVVLELG